MKRVWLYIRTADGGFLSSAEMEEQVLSCLTKTTERRWKHYLDKRWHNPGYRAKGLDDKVLMIFEQAPVGFVGGVYTPHYVTLLGLDLQRPVQDGEDWWKLAWA